MVTLNQVIKVFAINCRGGDTEGTRASGIAEETVKICDKSKMFHEHYKHRWQLTDLDGTIDLGHNTTV